MSQEPQIDLNQVLENISEVLGLVSDDIRALEVNISQLCAESDGRESSLDLTALQKIDVTDQVVRELADLLARVAKAPSRQDPIGLHREIKAVKLEHLRKLLGRDDSSLASCDCQKIKVDLF